MRFAFDTNILVYNIDADAGPRHDIAMRLLELAAGKDCILPLQVLGELFRVLTVKRRMPPRLASEVVDAWRQTFPVVAAGEDCLEDAMAAVADHGFSFWDAMIWATAKRAGCRLLITEDGQDGRTLGGVTIVDPFVPDPSPLLADVFR